MFEGSPRMEDEALAQEDTAYQAEKTEMTKEERAAMLKKQDENMAQKGKGREPFPYPDGYKGI